MERVFEYRPPHISKMRKVIPMGLIIVGVLQFILAVSLAGFKLEVTMISGVLGAVLIGEALVMRCVFGRFTKVQCMLTEEGITYINKKGTTNIPYDEIDSIEFPSIKYTGGWIKIKSGKKVIRLTVVIKSIQEFVIGLAEIIEERELDIKMKDKAYRSFLRTATYSDYSWDRVYKIWWKLLLVTIATSLMSFGIPKLIGFELMNTGLLTMIGYAFPTIVYLMCEITLGRGLSKRFKAENTLIPTRDLVYESIIYHRGKRYGSVAFVAYLLVIIFTNYFI